MDVRFNRAAFLAISAIAFISMLSMFFMSQTGAYSWSFGNVNKDGMCYCHQGSYQYPGKASFITSCLNGIEGKGVVKIGMTTHNSCLQQCGPRTYWWCRR